MKFLLTYDKPKKSKFVKKSAVFFNIEDAVWFEKMMIDQGCKNSQVRPL
jgi:hypothetical protein|tara:strand:+ start:947 stop:1093 length:147 start_codon:yes stop_codon:yes gene_type:complete